MVQKSLYKCPFLPIHYSIRIKMTDPKQVRNDSFCKDIMNEVKEKLKSYDDELFDDHPFDSDHLDVWTLSHVLLDSNANHQKIPKDIFISFVKISYFVILVK